MWTSFSGEFKWTRNSQFFMICMRQWSLGFHFKCSRALSIVFSFPLHGKRLTGDLFQAAIKINCCKTSVKQSTLEKSSLHRIIVKNQADCDKSFWNVEWSAMWNRNFDGNPFNCLVCPGDTYKSAKTKSHSFVEWSKSSVAIKKVFLELLTRARIFMLS